MQKLCPTVAMIILMAVSPCWYRGTLLWAGGDDNGERAASLFRIASFSADVTIPLGHRCMGILPTKSHRIVDPLYAHGFVILGAGKPIVLCAVDWCEIRNEAYTQWRQALAEAAATSPERVLVCALHQHDAPVVDRRAALLLEGVGLANELYDVEFHDRTLRRVAQALRVSLGESVPVTHIGMGQARVSEIASNRRVVLPNGKVTFDRGSRSGADEFHRNAPEGEIDPVLKTLSFWNDTQPVVALHSYATHPMSYYGRGEVSADFVGLARDRRQRDDFSIRQVYVSGCSGDVTAGKFNTGSIDDRMVLTQRLYDGMVAAWKSTKRVPLHKVSCRQVPLYLPFNSRPELDESVLVAALRDTSLPVERRILAAMGLASRERASSKAIDLACLDFGEAVIVLFPGEAFVRYQLRAQEILQDRFVMSIGYGESWPGYIPTESAFREGFGDSWLWVDPGSEERLEKAMQRLLGESRAM